MPRVLYRCDPELNNACPKVNCHLNGGPCIYTSNPRYAKKNTTALFVFDVDDEDRPSIEKFKGDDFRD